MGPKIGFHLGATVRHLSVWQCAGISGSCSTLDFMFAQIRNARGNSFLVKAAAETN